MSLNQEPLPGRAERPWCPTCRAPSGPDCPTRSTGRRTSRQFGKTAAARLEGWDGHRHVDRGGGCCDCGAQRCCLPGCDGWCVHLDGWIEVDELEHMRAMRVREQLTAACALPERRDLFLAWGLDPDADL